VLHLGPLLEVKQNLVKVLNGNQFFIDFHSQVLDCCSHGMFPDAPYHLLGHINPYYKVLNNEALSRR
jgi:hypothetical protein